MKFRLSEGSGECFYYLGVEDDGYPRGLEPQELQDSIAVIHHMAVSLQVGHTCSQQQAQAATATAPAAVVAGMHARHNQTCAHCWLVECNC